ncbi:MAG: T9SS type B sorting domain-containing protein, partial [Flavobacterium sp.]
MWLSLFVLSGFLSVGAVTGGINPFEYLGDKEIAEVYNDQDEPKPEVKVGKPHDIEQALPNETTSGNFRVFLGEAIKNRTTGLVTDAEGNAIVPEGYIYSFHDTQDEANRNTNKIIDEILYVDKFNPTTAPLTRFLRVQSVIDPIKVVITAFTIEVKPEPATLNDRVTGRPDQYNSADKDGNATFVLLEDKNQLYYGNSETELFKVDGASKTKLTDAEINNFITNKNQVIEAKITLDGETAVRQ